MQSKEYLEHPGMRQSQLKHILDGVDEYKLHRDNSWRPSEEQLIGSAVHVLVLEPEKAINIVALPKFDGKTRLGKIFNYLAEGRPETFFPLATGKTKRQGEGFFYEVDYPEYEFMIGNLQKYGHVFKSPQDYIALSESAFEAAHKMAENVRKNTDANTLLSRSIKFEEERYFEFNEMDWKCCLDHWGRRTDDVNFVCDLKTTSIKNDNYLIEREIRQRRYHVQGALYLLSLRPDLENVFDDEGNFVDDFTITWVRNVEPYTVFPTTIRAGLMREGFELLLQGSNLYKDCLINNPEFIANNRIKII